MSEALSAGKLRQAWYRIRGGRQALPPQMVEAAAVPEPNPGGEMVNEERERILRILDEGRISAPEANELLQAIGEPPLGPASSERPIEPGDPSEPRAERPEAPRAPEERPGERASSQEAWKAFEEQLRALGRTVGETVRAGFSSAGWRDFEGNLNRLGDDIAAAVDSGQVDEIKQQATQLAGLAAAAVEQTMVEVQPQIDAALHEAGEELQRVVEKLNMRPAPTESSAAAATERQRILQMLQEQRIDAEEAERLLIALEHKAASSSGRPSRQSSGRGRRVNLSGLVGANLRGARLEGAKIGGADFEGAVLEGANLQGADLTGADLTGAVLNDANLQGADLRGADLTGAVLGGANLQGANLRGADLDGAVLRGVILQGANLENADLAGTMIEDGADLKGVDLSGQDLAGAKLTADLVRQMLTQADS